jgi:hypothetical protein
MMVEDNFKKISRKRFVGDLFRELGFSVQMMDCRELPNPIFQIQHFMHSDNETQWLSERRSEIFRHRNYLNNLDYILTHPNGSVKYLKVIDQDSIVLTNKGFDIFDVYPEAIVLSMASYWSDPTLKDTVFSDDADPALIDQIRDSFFQVHHVERALRDRTKISTCSLQEWLAKEYGMARDTLIERYIALVLSWPFVTPRFLF